MKANKKRIERLENKIDATERIPLEVCYVNKEQIDHPERFKAVLDREDVGESGMVIRYFKYERL